ncbi:outer membrane lipoprotein carrier protein LolA [Oceanobacter mangrovi]|uniref:outer membrane lipoprotein carrier protein LolA n=1 Tax=Oceanobacter mangrovi TaxID=2862510 RepID=UPI001C8D3C2D|nr:outer membrane lipoprotein carrier protein LolA [Oceanobacter mangrovi]
MSLLSRLRCGRILLLGMALSLPTALPVQAQTLATELDADQIARILTPTDQLQGQFQQDKYLAVLPRPLHSSGRFVYQRQQGLSWQIEQPIASTVVISDSGISQTQNGQLVWQSDANSPQTTTVANIMAAIFAGDLATLQTTFDISGAQQPDQPWQLQLTPKSEVLKNFFSQIDMTGAQQLQGLVLHEASGDRTEIRFTIEAD